MKSAGKKCGLYTGKDGIYFFFNYNKLHFYMDFFSCIIYYSYKSNFVLFQMMPYICPYDYWFKSYMPICNFKSAPT